MAAENKALPPVSLIAAMSANRVIGRDNRLPWYLPADLAHFKRLTMGKPMLMGRNTWESLPGLLPGRRHIVLSRDPHYRAVGAEVAHSLDAALQLTTGADELMIIGGANLYAQCIPLAQQMYLTLVQVKVAGDAWFPEYDARAWQEAEYEDYPADANNPYGYRFVRLRRIS